MRRTTYGVVFTIFCVLIPSALCQSLGIYKMQVDGSAQQQIVPLPQVTRINGLVLSPDSTHIAWGMTVIKKGTPNAGIYLIGSDGKGQHELPLPSGIKALSNPAFSPDGKKLLVSELDIRSRETIALENLDGSDRTVIITDGNSGSFNSDGTKIVFVRESLGSMKSQLIISDSNGKNERIIATDALMGLLSLPSFNPADSNQVIYRAHRDGKNVLALADLNSDTITDAIPANTSNYILMSTNGKLAVYEQSGVGAKSAALFLATFGNAKATAITHDDSISYSYPQLSQDGKSLICFGYRTLPSSHHN